MADVSVSPFDIIAGPAHVFVAPIAEAFPAVETTPPAGNWVDLGYTDGGIEVQHNQTINELRVDQVAFPVKAIRTEYAVTVTFSIAQLTLENYKFALNKVTTDAVTTSGKGKVISLDPGVSVKTMAMLVRAPSPYGTGSEVTDWWLQYELSIVYQNGEPQVSFNRDDKAVLALSFMALGNASGIGNVRARNSA